MGPVTTPSEELVVADDRGTELEPAPAPAPADRRSRWRRLDKKLLIASVVIACGAVLIAYGVSTSITGDDASNRPPAVEEITPAFNAVQVPQQITIVADLQAGYFGYLEVDGVDLPTVRLDEVGSQDVEPGEQVEFPPGARFEPGNATLTFTPGSEQDVDTLEAGVHTVRVVFWKEIEGPETARSYSWTFTVV
jgi:hypothetical protein